MNLDPRVQIILGAVLFSTGGAAIKAISLSAWQIAAFRSGVAAVALLLMVPATRRGWSWRILPVAVFYAATMTLFVLANKLTTAASAIFLQSTAPLYLLFLGPLLLREPLHSRDLWFLGVMGLGLSLFFVTAAPASATAPSPLAGNILGGLAGVTWACTILGLRWLARDIGHSSPAAAATAGNALTFCLAAWWAFPVTYTNPTDWALIGYLGIFQIGLAYVFVTSGVRRVPAFEVSLLILVEPVLNPIWAWVFHREEPGAFALLGGGIILAATCLRILQNRQNRCRSKLS